MNPVHGTRVLVVEDEPIVAMLVEDLLDTIGCLVAGNVASIAAANHAIERGGFDVALIDINLDGEDGLVVADALKARGIRYVIASGYGATGLAERHPGAPVLAKPYAIAALETAIAECLS